MLQYSGNTASYLEELRFGSWSRDSLSILRFSCFSSSQAKCWDSTLK
jgi:hypothetical protein